MADEGPSRFRIARFWLVVVGSVVTVVLVLGAVAFTPSLSPFPAIRDADADGVPDAQDLWDAGNGGLVVRVEAFELISGFCDFFSNCEPSFRLQVDIDQDGVVDVAQRADFEDFLDTQPLIDPASWTFDVPDDMQEIDLILFVPELDIFSGDGDIDIHPDPEFTAGWIKVQASFLYVQIVSQGDKEPVG